MSVVSFSFDKIVVERKKALEVPLKAKTSIKVTDIKEEELTLAGGRKDLLLRFLFEYFVDYQTNQASVLLGGNVLYSGKREDLEKVVKEWKKTKKFTPQISKEVLNHVFMRCNIKALSFEQEVNIPPHIVLPHLQPVQGKKNKAEDYIG